MVEGRKEEVGVHDWRSSKIERRVQGKVPDDKRYM